MIQKLGPKIQKYLKEEGISQDFLAERLEISVSSLNQMLTGSSKLPAEVYLKICQLLHRPVDYFIEP